MCETHAYVVQNGQEELIMDSVVLLRPENGQIYLRNLMGKETAVRGKIKEINFLDHRLVLTVDQT